MASLVKITRESLRAFRQHRFLWWFAVPIGILIGASSFLSEKVRESFSKTSDLSSLTPLLTERWFLLIVSASFLIALLQSVLRGMLVAVFIYQLNNDRTIKSVPPSPRDILRSGFVSVSFEFTYWVFMAGIGIVIALPMLLSRHFNPTITPIIFELGFILVVTLGVYLYFIKELSCLYAIIGKVYFRSSLDLGIRLFRKHTFSTVLFFSYAALLALLMGVLMTTLFRLFHMPDPTGDNLSSLVFISALFGLYFVFDQILRVTFFRSIAASPEKPLAKERVIEAAEAPSGLSSN